MLTLKRNLGFALIACSLLTLSGCADDNLAKGLLVAGGAGAGAFIGKKVAGPGSGITGPIIGAASGGLLGYLLGGSIGSKAAK